jgi:hypothetical protein
VISRRKLARRLFLAALSWPRAAKGKGRRALLVGFFALGGRRARGR